MPFDFPPALPKPMTWREIIKFLPEDSGYPSDVRAFDTSRIKKALAWDAAPTFEKAKSPVQQQSTFLDRPFNYQTIDELFDGLRAAELRLADKTLQNARSICNAVADHYHLARGIGHTPFSEDCQRLHGMGPSKWDRRALRPGLHYLSSVCVSPWTATQANIDDFEKAVFAEFRLAEPRATFNEFTRVWNKCANLPGWPELVIERHVVSKRCAVDWAEYSKLKRAIEQYIDCGRRFEELENIDDDPDAVDDDKPLIVPLAAETAQGHRSSLGMVVWALRQGHVPANELNALRDLCIPTHFRLAMQELTTRAGGIVNRTVHARLVSLGRLAGHPGVLTEAELKTVSRIMSKYEQRHRFFLETHEDRDQKTLDQCDDESVMDALLALPTLTMERVLAKRDRHTIGCAYAIQRALILELWLCAPRRIGAFLSIELEEIVSMRLNAIERVMLRKPKRQSANKRCPEHYLNDDTVALLRLYLDDYRPMIMRHNKCPGSQHLFPGEGGGSKSKSSLRNQITKFVRRHTSLKDWHPHFVRKLTPKITLDADPGALEVARRTGGWANDRMLRDVYAQRVHRASQSKYLELLEGHRLHSIRSLGKRRKTKKRYPATPPTNPARPTK
jgi:site-specific recombinase XerD